MKVSSLTLRGFRNIEDCTFTPDSRLNFLIGANGQGKTSFLEALGYLATLRSFRGSKSAEVIRWGREQGEIICEIEGDLAPGETSAWKTSLRIVFAALDPSRAKVTKTAFINGKPYRSSTS